MNPLVPLSFSMSPLLRNHWFWMTCFFSLAALWLGYGALFTANPPKAPRTQAVHSLVSDLFDGNDHQSKPDAPIPVNLYTFGLNAFLVPLLDDSVPPKWTEVAVEFTCGPGTSILVDGQPMVPGNALPPRSFTLQWAMDKCFPLGQESVELTGGVELVVSHTSAGFRAEVKPDELLVDSYLGRAWLQGPFTAETALDTPTSASRSKNVHVR